jgi:alpha-D-ribose 1-methylphosphonate 5-triphosphate synthase subunit PhnH
MNALKDLAPGFGQPQLDAQRVFRQALQTMSRPGQILSIDRLPEPPAPLHPAAAALGLTLLDLETPVWLSEDLRGPAADYLAFHTGAPRAPDLDAAAFVMIGDGNALPDLSKIALGDPEYPERAATLIIQVERLRAGTGRRLRGPGILGHSDVAADGLADAFWDALALNRKRFPLGFDAFLVAGDSVLGLPRTVFLDNGEG